MKFSEHDKRFMLRALELAGRGGFLVSPNPKVGAVLASRGKIIAEGWHKIFGGPHAEQNVLKSALRKAKNSVTGSTLYINLEPCVSYEGKKTAACASALIQAKISRVVIGMKDPSPMVSGRGISMLRHAGIKVDVGCLSHDAEKLNVHFITWMKTRMPYVAMKVAMSLDGKIATKTGESKWITSEKSRKFVRSLRDSYDAILVGANTVLRDNPTLSGARRQPLRIVLDSTLRVPISANIFRDLNAMVITTSRAPISKINQLKKRGIKCKIFPKKITMAPLLRYLAKQNISSLFVEGGAEIFGSFLDSRLINKLYWFIAPTIIGGADAKAAVSGSGVARMRNALRLNLYTLSRLDGDILVTAQLDGSSKR